MIVELGPDLVEARLLEGVVKIDLRPEGLPPSVTRVLPLFGLFAMFTGAPFLRGLGLTVGMGKLLGVLRDDGDVGRSAEVGLQAVRRDTVLLL